MYYSDSVMYQKIIEANRSLNGGELKSYQDATANDIQRLADKVIEDCGNIPLYAMWEIKEYVAGHCSNSIDVTEEFTREYRDNKIENLDSVFKFNKFVLQEDGWIRKDEFFRCYTTDNTYIDVNSYEEFKSMIEE